jgi:hypothetical protein
MVKAFGPSDTPWIEALNVPDVYLSHEAAASKGLNWEPFVANAATAARSVPEVAALYVSGEVSSKDPFAEIYVRSFFPGRSGDLLLRMKPGILVSSLRSGTSHGSPYDDDALVPLLFYGPSFQSKTFVSDSSLEDILPTLAAVLKMTVPAQPGRRALSEAFR